MRLATSRLSREGLSFTRTERSAYDYLCQVTFFLKEYSGIEFDELAKTIPEELLTAGPKDAPQYDHQQQLFMNV